MRAIEFDEDEFTKKYNEGLCISELVRHFGCSRTAIINKLKRSGLVSNKPKPFKHTDESKKKLSESRKKFLKNNPDKHPWKCKDKFQSVPCDNVKKFLKDNYINFVEEFDVEIPDRNFSIDIAIPDKKLAIEINGQQHYNSNGRLKSYYQDRHDLIKESGWEVLEIHYSVCFNFDSMDWVKLISQIRNKVTEFTFDYFNYVPKSKKIIKCIDCNKVISKNSKRCKSCSNKNRSNKRIIPPSSKEYGGKPWPPKEELEKEVWETPSSSLCKKYGVSDKTIQNWCKAYGIEKPPRGYWRKLKCGK